MLLVFSTHCFQADRSFTFTTSTPPVSYFLLQAAGLEKGASQPGWTFLRFAFFPSLLHFRIHVCCLHGPGKDLAGKVTLKHIYEIAKVKSQVHALAEFVYLHNSLLLSICMHVMCFLTTMHK